MAQFAAVASASIAVQTKNTLLLMNVQRDVRLLIVD